MFTSAFAPRNSGCVITKPCEVWLPQPIDPTPGMRPIQFAERIKMKIVAKYQKVLSVKCGPTIQDKKLYNPPTSHSTKFWRPAGTIFMFRVAA